MTFSSGTGILVGVDILACNGWNLNVMNILSSSGIHLPDKEKRFTFALHSHKISTPTGTPVPDKNVTELSSKDSKQKGRSFRNFAASKLSVIRDFELGLFIFPSTYTILQFITEEFLPPETSSEYPKNHLLKRN